MTRERDTRAENQGANDRSAERDGHRTATGARRQKRKRDHPSGSDDSPTFETEALFDPETYLPVVESVLGPESTETDVDFLAERFDHGAKLLDAPCGHGRHANRLADRGYRVAGLDQSTDFLERARTDARDRGVAGRVDYTEGDLRSLPYDDDRFDGVYNLFTSFGFFDEAGNRGVLEEFARVLGPDGRLVMELANRDALLYDYRPTSVTQTEAATVVEERSFDPETGRNHTERLTVLAGDDGEENGDDRRLVQEATFEVRLYSFTELRWLLSDAGFEVVETYGTTAGDDLTLDAGRMVVVADRTGVS